MSEEDGDDEGTLLDRFLRVFSDVRRGEGATALILAAKALAGAGKALAW